MEAKTPAARDPGVGITGLRVVDGVELLERHLARAALANAAGRRPKRGERWCVCGCACVCGGVRMGVCGGCGGLLGGPADATSRTCRSCWYGHRGWEPSNEKTRRGKNKDRRRSVKPSRVGARVAGSVVWMRVRMGARQCDAARARGTVRSPGWRGASAACTCPAAPRRASGPETPASSRRRPARCRASGLSEGARGGARRREVENVGGREVEREGGW